ncbi:MAG: diaminopimelate epimerase, partial [candidate division Zixibacteria bacterium]|nr:diaminopimelate epimerase [candidate division Zixibacteria bacterium]
TVRKICHRNRGVGADGLLYLSKAKNDTVAVDVYNADGGWAEKSGNGLRIAGLHLHRQNSKKRNFTISMGGTKSRVTLVSKTKHEAMLTTEIGKPSFEISEIPIKSKSQFMINSPIILDGIEFPVTCLSVGNPHAVLFVDNFDFDWQQIGADIENHKIFPNGTNVEFVKVMSSKNLRVANWERGAGPTGSSGTGAAAAVAASVMLGVAGRKCKVVFETGQIEVNWRKSDDIIEISGSAEFICEGTFKSR